MTSEESASVDLSDGPALSSQGRVCLTLNAVVKTHLCCHQCRCLIKYLHFTSKWHLCIRTACGFYNSRHPSKATRLTVTIATSHCRSCIFFFKLKLKVLRCSKKGAAEPSMTHYQASIPPGSASTHVFISAEKCAQLHCL